MDDLSVQQIEEKLFEIMPPNRRRKVAYLIAIAGFAYCSEAKLNEALLKLSTRHDVVTYGNISNWRRSEMMRV